MNEANELWLNLDLLNFLIQHPRININSRGIIDAGFAEGLRSFIHVLVEQFGWIGHFNFSLLKSFQLLMKRPELDVNSPGQDRQEKSHILQVAVTLIYSSTRTDLTEVISLLLNDPRTHINPVYFWTNQLDKKKLCDPILCSAIRCDREPYDLSLIHI